MRKYILLPVLLSLCSISDLYAGAKNDGIDYRAEWKVNNGWLSSWNCKGSISTAGLSPRTDTYTYFNKDMRDYKNYAASYYIAREMTEGGVQFCKTIVAADRSNCHGKVHTYYYDNGNDCFWLCREGFNGSGCTNVQEPDVCKDEKFFASRKKTYDSTKLSSYTFGTNIEEKIPMFYANMSKDCGSEPMSSFDSEKKQEHDLILGLFKIGQEDVDKGKKGIRFTTVPMVVRAGGTQGCTWDSEHYGWPMIKWLSGHPSKSTTGGGDDVYLCPEGWVFEDADKRTCVPDSDATVCQLNNLCSNYPRDKFDPEKHTVSRACEKESDGTCRKDDNGKIVYDTTKCVEYRCNSGYAFTSKDDFTCTPCPATGVEFPELYYVNKQGLCVSCAKGEWPVEKEGNPGEFECKDAKPFTHNELQYGQKTVPDTVTVDQCWTKTNPDDFFGCVTGKCSDGKLWKKDGDCEGGGIISGNAVSGNIQVATKNTLNTTSNNMFVEQK